MRKKHTAVLFLFLFIVSLLIGQFLPGLHSQKAAAAAPTSDKDITSASFSFVDRAHIQATIGGQIFIFLDQNIDDLGHNYEIQNSDCHGEISFDATQGALENLVVKGSITPYAIDIDYKAGGVGKCTDSGFNGILGSKTKVSIPDTNLNIWYHWVDAGTIQRVDDNNNWTFKQTQDSSQSNQLFIDSNSNGCNSNFMIVSSDFKSFQTYRLEDNKANGRDGLSDVPNPNHDILKPVFPDPQCELRSTRQDDSNHVDYSGSKVAAHTYTLGDQDKHKTPATGPGFTGNATDAQHPTCESVGGPLSWFLCGIFNGMASFADWMLDNIVQPLLHSSPISTDPTSDTFKVWSTFRVYGNILLIVALLVLVIGQSIGGGLVDAYTAKKMVPRILIAAILINLSIYIVAAAIDITNIVGGGIGGLIIGPFRNNSLFTFTPNGIQRVGAVVGVVGGGGIAAFLSGLLFLSAAAHGITAAVGFIALFVLLPAVLAIAGAFVTIVLRQGLILFLILVSPVAFALYCLPNTEQFFKKWWNLFFKTLLVYPIIIIVFAISDVMTVTIMRANGLNNGQPLLASVPNNLLAGLVAFVVQFLPLALIPFAFKFAGGAVATVHEMLTGHGKRLTEFIKGDAADPNSLRRRSRDTFRSARLMGRGAGMRWSESRYMGLGRERIGYNPDGSPIYRDVPLTRGRRIRRGAYARFGSALYRGGVTERGIAELTAKEQESVDKQQATGPDASLRAFWSYRDAEGRWRSYYDDKEVPEAAVRAARRNVAGNLQRIQGNLSYETGKVNDEVQYGQLMQRWAHVADDMGLDDYSTASVWKGVTFRGKGVRLASKHRNMVRDPNTGEWGFGDIDAVPFSREFAKIRAGEVGAQYGGSFGATRRIAEDIANRGLGNMTDDELETLQNFYSAYTNLESPLFAEAEGQIDPAAARQRAPRRQKGTPVANSEELILNAGQGGTPNREMQDAANYIYNLARQDPRIREKPTRTENSEALPYGQRYGVHRGERGRGPLR